MIRPVPLADTRPMRQAVLRPHETLSELATHEPAEAFAVGAFAGDELRSVGFIAPDGETDGAWRVRGMATLPQARGAGVGAAVLHALLRHAAAQNATRVWCNARITALSLYARAGLRVSSEPFELPEIGLHVVMEWRPDDDAQALSSTGESSVRSQGRNPTRS